jgi:hypothetical protein
LPPATGAALLWLIFILARGGGKYSVDARLGKEF